MATKTNHVYFNSRDILLRVDLSSVVYFEADGNYTKFVSINGRSDMVGINLSRMEELLARRASHATTTFVRVGKRYILNTNYVYCINTLKQELVLSDQHSFCHTISISKVALKALKDIISPQPKTDKK